MRKLFLAMSLLAVAASPATAQKEIAPPADGGTKEYDTHFDQWGHLHCENTGTKCTAPA
jgi:hypothetical protein